MLIDFIAIIAVGFAAAGLILVANHLAGRRLARWALPAGVGLAMIVFSVWREYSWFPTVTAQLSDSIVVASAPADRVFWRPWTYAVPLVTRFVAIDRGAARQSTSTPGLFVASAVVIQRWTPTQRVPMAFDCTAHRRADLFEGAALGPDGTLTGAEWRQVAADDPLIVAACNGG